MAHARHVPGDFLFALGKRSGFYGVMRFRRGDLFSGVITCGLSLHLRQQPSSGLPSHHRTPRRVHSAAAAFMAEAFTAVSMAEASVMAASVGPASRSSAPP